MHRGDTCFVVANLFPYTTGHLLVVPYREVADLDGLTGEETADLWATVTDAVRVVRAVYAARRPERRAQPRPTCRRFGARSPPRPRRATLDRRFELHVGDRQHPDPARGARRHRGETPRRLGERGRRASVAWTAMTDDLRDELPADLDPSVFVGPYQFPDNSRRRWPGVLYLVIAAISRGGLRRVRRRGDRQRRLAGGRRRARGRRGVLDHERLEDARRRDRSPGRCPAGPRVPGRVTLRLSRCGAGCAVGRRGGCSATRRRTRRPNVDSCWSMRSTVGSSSISARTTPNWSPRRDSVALDVRRQVPHSGRQGRQARRRRASQDRAHTRPPDDPRDAGRRRRGRGDRCRACCASASCS